MLRGEERRVTEREREGGGGEKGEDGACPGAEQDVEDWALEDLGCRRGRRASRVAGEELLRGRTVGDPLCWPEDAYLPPPSSSSLTPFTHRFTGSSLQSQPRSSWLFSPPKITIGDHHVPSTCFLNKPKMCARMCVLIKEYRISTKEWFAENSNHSNGNFINLYRRKNVK